jgi:hypothetical protein
MSVLRKAVEKGFGDVLRLKGFDAYDPLRNRNDFKKLVASLEAKAIRPREVAPPPREVK